MAKLQIQFDEPDNQSRSSLVSRKTRRDAAIVMQFHVESRIEPIKLTGTTTFARDAIHRLASRWGLADHGYLEIVGTIQREPENEADSDAIAVHVEGERIAYLPGFLARRQTLSVGASLPVQVQIFTELLPKGLRAEAWAWLSSQQPQWKWSETNRPPLSSRSKWQATHQGRVDKVRDSMASGGEHAHELRSGMTNGVHYLELVEPIKELKREGRLEDALVLCLAAVNGAERSAERKQSAPAPWYTEQAAIVLRKLGRRDEEIAVLERWIAACPPHDPGGRKIRDRLDKLRR